MKAIQPNFEDATVLAHWLVKNGQDRIISTEEYSIMESALLHFELSLPRSDYYSFLGMLNARIGWWLYAVKLESDRP